MKTEIHHYGHAAAVSIDGSIDGLTAETLMEAFRAHVQAGHTRLVADFGGVDYTSSAGLRALLATMKDARMRGGDLRLSNVNPDVLKVLELSGFTSIMKVYADVEMAIGSYAEQ